MKLFVIIFNHIQPYATIFDNVPPYLLICNHIKPYTTCNNLQPCVREGFNKNINYFRGIFHGREEGREPPSVQIMNFLKKN